MGKIRIKTVGETSPKLSEKRSASRGKKQQKQELQALASNSADNAAPAKKSDKAERTEKKKKFQKPSKVPSKTYTANLSLVKKNKTYNIDEALTILKTFQKAKFDETVELHINVKEKGINGQVTLPHGTGKKVRIRIVDDATIAAIEKGDIDFDILIAHPSMMPKLAKVARILGPRGLMPNPKAGTISSTPEAVVEKLSAGQVNFKTESQAPIVHMSVGKVSFEDKKLAENITAAIKALPENKIENVTLKATMTPGIRLDISTLVK